MIRDWEGLRYDDSASGDGALIAQNTRFYVDGELQRRPGLEAQSAGAVSNAKSFCTYGDALGRQFIVLFLATGTIQTVQI